MTSPFVSGDIGTYGLSGNSKIDPLLVWGYKWGSTSVGTSVSLTYSFPGYGATWLDIYYDGEPYNGFVPFITAQRNAAREALSLWSEVVNVTFNEITETNSNVGDLRFGNSVVVTNSTAAAWAYLPYDDQWEWPENGDVWVDYQYAPNRQLAPGQYGFSTMVHEIGHAIGLDHPFADVAGELALPKAYDNQRYTIMSYTLYSGATIEAYGPMLYDILAIQYLYGANMTTRADDTVYTFSASKEYLECIWDAGGHDTIDLSNQTRDQVIDLRSSAFSSIGIKNNGATATGNVGIAYNVLIEDAIGGAGNDKITGNNGANELRGASGNDTIDGYANADIMYGGRGNDTYMVDNAGDQVIETTSWTTGGTDLVNSAVSFALDTNFENLTLTGTGDINATGNVVRNILRGNDGDNRLDGGGGNDTMMGGKGHDTYVVGSANDIIYETVLNSSGGGVDTVESSVAFTLATQTNIEHLTLTGSGTINGTGNDLGNRITGNSGHNILSGGAGVDTLGGFEGVDTLKGGTGNDLLRGGDGFDMLNGGAGRDTYDFNFLSEAGDTITGFTLGVTGDILDLADLLDNIGYGGTNPFLDAIVTFAPLGSDTIVSIDGDGGGAGAATTLVTLTNVALTQADTNNYLV